MMASQGHVAAANSANADVVVKKKRKLKEAGEEFQKKEKTKKKTSEVKRKKEKTDKKTSDQQVPTDILSDTIAAKSKAKTRRKKVAVEGKRTWKEEGFDGSLTRHVPFTEEETRRINEAITAYCDMKHLSEIEFHDKITHEAHNGRGSDMWTEIASIAELPRRSINSIRSRIKRTLEEKGKFTKDQLQKLQDFIVESPGRPKWKQIGEAIGKGAEACRNQWKAALTITGEYKTRGELTCKEEWFLRTAVVEVTNKLAPVDNISWMKVQRWLPHRSHDFCRQMWYRNVLPKLLQYQDKHGIALDPDIFKRHILRQVKKSNVEDADDVLWANVNQYWPAWMNRDFVRRAWGSLPSDMKLISQGGTVYDECLLPHFQDCIKELMQEHSCKKLKKQDRRTLRHAKLVLEAKAEELSDASDGEVGEQ